MSSNSIGRVLLLFYVIVASNYTDNLISKELRTLFRENRIVQHLIGVTLMLSLVILFGGVKQTDTAMMYALLCYIWFILTTKLNGSINIVILLLLIFGFIYEQQIINKIEESGKVLDDSEKSNIINKYNYRKNIFIITLVSITVIGTLFFANDKKIQHGGGFDLVNFLFY